LSYGDSQRKKKFCDLSCSATYNNLRKQRKHVSHRACEGCGQPATLVMDHINGKSEDNRVVNLRLVCGNCDMQLPTYKSKNIGNGRHKRRKRYADGKSY